jgi:hypothetical protein
MAVCSLNWKQGYFIEDVIINGVFTFGLMYALTEGILYLFEKYDIWISLGDNAIEKPDDYIENTVDVSIDDGYIVPEEKISTQNPNYGYTGQVEPTLSMGLPDDQIRLEMKEKMGLN